MRGIVLVAALSCSAARVSIGMAVRARVEVVKSLWRRSGAMRNDIVTDSNLRTMDRLIYGDGFVSCE
jgi:hypothetical protein